MEERTLTARTYDKVVREPVPWKKRAVVFTPWRRGPCETCGAADWLRYWTAELRYECQQCWLEHKDHSNGSHGPEDDARLRWLWQEVKAGRL